MKRCWLIFSFLWIMLPFNIIADNDISMVMYTDKGEIGQLNFASKAISRSCPTIGFVDQNTKCSCVISCSEVPSSLCNQMRRNIEYSSELGCVLVINGYKPDCDYLRNEYCSYSQNHKLLYAENPPIDCLSSHLSQWITRGLYSEDDEDEIRIARPLATSIMLSKYDDLLDKNRLVIIDNSGYIADYKHCITGSISPARQLQLQNSIVSNDIKDSIESLKQRIIEILDILESEETSNIRRYEICLLDHHHAVECSYEGHLMDKKGQISTFVESLWKKKS
mmetsp:Transcript_33223/g.48067  ORF Transcript_33223/g.48067 Transcript_33223/m.48067 type:complete len:279 (+) Transcript_33223:18-854(+)